MSEPIDFFAEPIPVAKDSLETLVELAQESRRLQADVDARNLEIAKDQERINHLNQSRIPSLMAEMALTSFSLEDGTIITVEDKVRANISPANKEAAFNWLKNHGFDGIIKTKIQSEFGRGELERARGIVLLLRENGVEAVMDQTIHPQTLVSFVKERLAEAGDVKSKTSAADGFDNEDTEIAATLPQDLFGVFENKNAKFKLPKTKK